MAFVDETTGGRVILRGIRPVKVTLSSAVSCGDLVGYSSGWKAADMNSSPKIYPELIAGVTAASGAEIDAFREAVIDFGTGCTATAGDSVFASVTAGQYVSPASNDQGYCVGVMNTAQVAFINPAYALPLFKWPNTEYSNTSGTVILQQLKGALSATGTASMTGIECAPKVLSAVAAGTIRGLYTALDIEGTAAGTITTACGVESNIGSDSGSGRTITNAHAYYAVNNLHGTVTNGPYVMKVDTHGGNVAWAGLLLLPDDGAIASDGGTPGAVTGATGWIKVVVGSATRYIALASSVS